MAQNITDQISGVKFIRCKLASIQTGTTSSNNLVSDVTLRGCIIQDANLYRASNILFDACFINYIGDGISGTTVNNCVLGLQWGLSIGSNTDVLYENNIFLYNISTQIEESIFFHFSLKYQRKTSLLRKYIA